MSEFLLLYRNTTEARRRTIGSPENARQTTKKWRAWFDELDREGHLKSIGQRLEEQGKVVRPTFVTDGPYAETKDLIGGYSLIEASDLEEAAKIAARCPVLENGGSVEVREVMQVNA
jgi:hypothetical protein